LSKNLGEPFFSSFGMTSPVVGAWVGVGVYVPTSFSIFGSHLRGILIQQESIDTEIGIQLSPPHRLPLGIPIKIATIEKQKAREGR